MYCGRTHIHMRARAHTHTHTGNKKPTRGELFVRIAGVVDLVIKTRWVPAQLTPKRN